MIAPTKPTSIRSSAPVDTSLRFPEVSRGRLTRLSVHAVTPEKFWIFGIVVALCPRRWPMGSLRRCVCCGRTRVMVSMLKGTHNAKINLYDDNTSRRWSLSFDQKSLHLFDSEHVHETAKNDSWCLLDAPFLCPHLLHFQHEWKTCPPGRSERRYKWQHIQHC